MPLMIPTKLKITVAAISVLESMRQMNVAFRGTFDKGTPEREWTHRPGNQIRDHDPGDSAESSNDQSLREELKQNVPAPRAQGFLYANLAGALRHRHQHDVHQPNAADAERQQADEAEQNLDSDCDDLQFAQLVHAVEHEYGSLVLGIEIVMNAIESRTAFDTFSCSPSYSIAMAFR